MLVRVRGGRLRGEEGAAALYLVLAAVAIFLALVGTLALQARHELRMGTAETEASARIAMLTGALEEAAVLAEEYPGWPAMEATDGTTECSSFKSAGRFRYCRDVLPERLVGWVVDASWIELKQYPVRVTWMENGSSEKHHEYAWIVVDPADLNPDTGKPAVWAVVPYKLACRPNPDYLNVGYEESFMGPCFPGT